MVTEKEAKGKRNITLQSKVSKRSSILSLFSTLLKHNVRLFFFLFISIFPLPLWLNCFSIIYFVLSFNAKSQGLSSLFDITLHFRLGAAPW